MPTLLNYFIAGTIGILLNIFAVKIPKLKTLGKAANHPFSFKEYIADDWSAIVASLLSVLAIIWGWAEIIVIKPQVENYATLLFIFIGFTGSSIVLAILSVASKKLTSVIDIKSNVADGIQPPINEGNADGLKEIAKEQNN